jgi:hypothetical protein
MKEGRSRQQTAARTNGAPVGLGDGSLGGVICFVGALDGMKEGSSRQQAVARTNGSHKGLEGHWMALRKGRRDAFNGGAAEGSFERKRNGVVDGC